MSKASKIEKATANLAILKNRIGQGLMTKAALYPAVLDTSEAAFYANIRRKQVEAVDVGRAKLIPPHEGARLIGMKLDSAV